MIASEVIGIAIHVIAMCIGTYPTKLKPVGSSGYFERQNDDVRRIVTCRSEIPVAKATLQQLPPP